MLDAVQRAKPRGQEARRISFRDIDVEQIGYIYEGLLGYTVRRSDEVIVGVIGKDGAEPEFPLRVLEELWDEQGSDDKIAAAMINWAKTSSRPACRPARPPSPRRSALGRCRGRRTRAPGRHREQVAPRPAPALDRRRFAATSATGRSSSRRAGSSSSRPHPDATPAPTTPRARSRRRSCSTPSSPSSTPPARTRRPTATQWKLKSSTEILDLKVADIACGSGAFLVAAARYLAYKLVEAWRREGNAVLAPHELETKALREVVAHCLYGADINAMAVEMCKLSLWLVSLDRDLPFSFVDDKVLRGNSLLGLTSLKQLEALHINPPTQPLQGQFQLSGANELVERLDIDSRIFRAVSLRQQLATEIDERDPQRTAHAKQAQMAQLDAHDARPSKDRGRRHRCRLAVGGKPGRR